MNKLLLTCLTVFTLTSFVDVASVCYAQEGPVDRILVLREAKESRKTTAAVEAHLIDNIMEVKITARMYSTKPRIHNALIVGTKLGRLSIEAKEVLLAAVEEEEPYPTTKRGGFISFGRRTKKKKAAGTLTRELVEFKIPRDKVVRDKRYQIWVQVESMQAGGKYQTFKFKLEDFFERLKETAAIVALRNISDACEDFRSVQTPLTYPATLSELTPYIDADLAGATTAASAREYYYYTYAKVNDDEFTCTATPAEDEETAMRIFFLDESAVIKLDDADGLPLDKIPLP